MTVALGGQRGRDNGYSEKFEQGTALWYHLPQSTFCRNLSSILSQLPMASEIVSYRISIIIDQIIFLDIY